MLMNEWNRCRNSFPELYDCVRSLVLAASLYLADRIASGCFARGLMGHRYPEKHISCVWGGG
jgi:hypothetical protein